MLQGQNSIIDGYAREVMKKDNSSNTTPYPNITPLLALSKKNLYATLNTGIKSQETEIKEVNLVC